jgi:magnesium transporter
MLGSPLPGLDIWGASCNTSNRPKKVFHDEAIQAALSRTGLTWIHIIVSDHAAATHLLEQRFQFHPFQVRDALADGDRADVVDTQSSLFVTLPAVVSGDEEEQYHEVAVFMDQSSVVSVARFDLPVLRRRFEQWVSREIPESETTAGILHGIVDAVVDDYFPVADRLQDELDALEDAVFNRNGGINMEDALGLKRRLLDFRRRVTPLRDVTNSLMRRDSEVLPPSLWPYFHDLYDQTLRLLETIDLDRDILTSIIDAHLTVVSNRLNEVMRFMTAISTMLMSVTLIASIYGMNFRHIPELEQWWGYPAALGTMAVIALVEYFLFKRKGWL